MSPTYESILNAMQERFQSLAGFPPDAASDVGIRMKVLASQLYELSEELVYIKKQLFVQTAQGQYLNLHAQARGLIRKEATPSKGTLRFFRQNPAEYEIVIPQGTVCVTDGEPSLRFETVRECLLPAGEIQTDISAVCSTGGACTNVAAGRICLMVTPPQGIAGVTNPMAFQDGSDMETDSALRDRLIRSYNLVSNGTNTAFYYDEAIKEEGVRLAAVIPRARGRGTVDVLVKAEPGMDEKKLIERIQNRMESEKEINVDVLVSAPKQQSVACAVEIAVREGFDFDSVKPAVEQAVSAYLETVAIGGPLYKAALVSAVFAVEGVRNCRLLSPSEDVTPAKDTLVSVPAIAVTRSEVAI